MKTWEQLRAQAYRIMINCANVHRAKKRIYLLHDRR